MRKTEFDSLYLHQIEGKDMVREYYKYDEETNTDTVTPVTLEDGHVWSEAVLDALEHANWHDAREAFAHTIHILPQIYDTLELFGYHKLSKKLQKSVDQWDRYF